MLSIPTGYNLFGSTAKLVLGNICDNKHGNLYMFELLIPDLEYGIWFAWQKRKGCKNLAILMKN